MDLKSCSVCGKIHPRGKECKPKRDYGTSEERKLRYTYAWKQKREQIKKDAFNLCEVCLREGVYTYEGLEVHHITKLRENPNGLLDDDNLITLCTFHHKQADAGEIPKEYLEQIARERGKHEVTVP